MNLSTINIIMKKWGINVNKNLVTRFPPEPSGYLHIGHVKALLINKIIADKYKGRLVVRIDDTNPTKSKKEFVDVILTDIRTLNINYDKLSYASDYFDQLIQYADNLVNDGSAYVDNTNKETISKQRFEGTESVCRNNSIEVNKKIWNKMKKGNLEMSEYALRIKIKANHKNKIMRDPIIYRLNLTDHYRINKYNVYPTYDFSCPIIDSLDGVTHAFRNVEYKERRELYYWILKKLSLDKIQVKEYNKLAFKYSVTSKRKIQKLIDDGHVSGWDDPRLPTVRGLLRRGVVIESMKEYLTRDILQTNIFHGRDVQVGWAKFWSLINKNLYKDTPRYFAIGSNCTVVKLDLTERTYVQRPLNPKNPEESINTSGSNEMLLEKCDADILKVGEKFTFMLFGNATITNVSDGITAEFSLGNPTKNILTFVDKNNCANCEMVYFDHIIKDDQINEYSKIVEEGFIEEHAKHLQVGDIVQIIRRGFARVDSNKEKIILHMLPTGKDSIVSDIPQFKLKN